jgi:hypothetical protein
MLNADVQSAFSIQHSTFHIEPAYLRVIWSQIAALPPPIAAPMSAPFLPPTAAPTPAPTPADEPMIMALFFTVRAGLRSV